MTKLAKVYIKHSLKHKSLRRDDKGKRLAGKKEVTGNSTKFVFIPPRCSLVTPRQWAKWYTRLTHKASSPRAKPSTSGTTWASDLQHPLLREWSVVWISTPPIAWIVCSLNLNTPCHVSGLWFNSQYPLLWVACGLNLDTPYMWVVCGLNLDTPYRVSGLWFESWHPLSCEWSVVWISQNVGDETKRCRLQTAVFTGDTYGDGWLPTVTTLCVWSFSFVYGGLCPASHSYCFTCPWAYYWCSSTVLDGGMDDLSLALAIQMKVVCLV